MNDSTQADTPLTAIFLMLFAMLCIVIADAIGKHLTQNYSIWQVLWIRSCVWLAFALVWISRRSGLRAALRSEYPLLQTARSLLLVAEVSVFILAYRSLPLGDVTAIGATTPLVVLAFSVVFLGERVGWRRWGTVALGFAGMLMVARPGAGEFGWLTLLPILGVLMWSGYQVLLRFVSQRDSQEVALLWSGCIMFVATGIMAPWEWRSPADAATWGWFVLAGVFNTLGHFSLIAAIQRAQASALQPFAYSTVAWALLLGWLIFDESPDSWTLGGTLLIVSAGLYAIYRERLAANGREGK